MPVQNINVQSKVEPKIGFGLASKAGYGVSALAAIGFVLALIFPEEDEQTISMLASAILSIVSFALTQVGRFAQAKEAIKVVGQPVPNTAEPDVANMASFGLAEQTAPTEEISAPVYLSVRNEQDLTDFMERTPEYSLENDPEILEDEEDEILPPDTEGLDPEYEGRDGTLEARLRLEQRDLGDAGFCGGAR